MGRGPCVRNGLPALSMTSLSNALFLLPPRNKKKVAPVFGTGSGSWPFVPCPPVCLGFTVTPSAELASPVGSWSSMSSEQSA